MVAPRVAIVDYGVGNLFSVAQACTHVGLAPEITSDSLRITTADAVILPGVGAFGFAMARLQDLGLISALLATAESGKPLVGICLGFQLLFEESEEMGHRKGLGLIKGNVRPLVSAISVGDNALAVRIPNIAWMPITLPHHRGNNLEWTSGLLDGVAVGSNMYFVHSYFVEPAQQNDILAETTYYGFKYCCASERHNVFGCQFHPEKSSVSGLQIYSNLARQLSN
jgi:imidazole glycerol-phosphate synthase subunit HisH